MDEQVYREPLPSACPPSKATEQHELVIYRAVSSIPAAAADFHSARMLDPERRFDCGECIARSVSIFRTKASCERILKLPAFRGKIVGSLTLTPESGRSMPTFSKDHLSWWIYHTFDPTQHCIGV
jgi:hypothetical protein